ncbi:type II secretion system minor pseudopilin GspJ [Sphingomonas sanguinis]|uniref:Type II secretion system minor pseudopilin GspJ n=1 Tax=Sphingomonas sanguinis TaxID=33051 RepID=A0ABU5LQB4_9SPHN|nr:type II secretion system minor pseudopilin GspJ [Sphingomonas sanguinis]MDZ7281931.1 type II secretion system minor pseudopilin GspJ [Sphingomonas sanguinis]QXT35442.1 type II secretion system minor pseudopilin GspJ [Sphingomonas sanguinis]
MPDKNGERRSAPSTAQQLGPGLRRGTGRNGFTLVEVMVALLIFSMLAAAAVAILSLSVRAQAATGQKLDAISAVSRTTAILSADLAQAVDRPTRDEGGVLTPAMVAGPDAMRLVRGGWSNLDNAARPSVQKVAYRLNGDVLERVAWPLLDGAAPMDPAALMDHVRELHLRYRFNGAWLDQWQGQPGVALPQAAEVTIVRDDGMIFRQLFLVGTGYVGAAVMPQPGPSPSPTPTPNG